MMQYAVIEVKKEFKSTLLPLDRAKAHLVVKTLDISFLNKKENYCQENLQEFKPHEYNDFDSKNVKFDYYLTRRVCPWNCTEEHSHLKDVRVYIKLLGKLLSIIL